MKPTRKQFLNRLAKEPMYFRNEFEDAVIKTQPTGSGLKSFVKFKGEHEFEAKTGSSIVVDSMLFENIISQEVYENY